MIAGARGVGTRLGELAGRDLALRDDHRAARPGPGRVGGGRGGGVAGRCADDRLGALAYGRGHRARHPAILERTGRVRALELQPDLGARALGEARREHKRRRALAQ